MSKTVAVVLLLVLAAALVGGGALLVANSGGDASDATDAGITVRDAWTAPNSGVTAVYLTITNGGADDELVAVGTGRAGKVSLMGGNAADVSHAVPQDATPVALDVPGGTTELRPGGPHLMVEDLGAALQPGTSFPLRLDFARNGPVGVPVEVVTWDEAAARSQ